jgi:putative membrane protein (TIGR04086 family)
MVRNKKVTGKATSMAAGLLTSLGLSMGITISGAALTAMLILQDNLPPEAMGYASVLILLIASTVGAWIASAMIKRRTLLVCAGVGGSYYLTLLAITSLFFGGQFQGMLVTAGVVLGGCGAVALLRLGRENKSRNKAKKYRFR